MKWFHYRGDGGDTFGFRDALISEDDLGTDEPKDWFVSPYCDNVTLEGTYELELLSGDEMMLPGSFGG